jgi:diguanylate cyclase (GGDEF)-like protein
MGEAPSINGRSPAAILLAYSAGFLSVFLVSAWLRLVDVQPDPALHAYLQAITALLSFVFASVTLVRFQGTQDRISLILGSGFLLSGTVLAASSVLFFDLSPNAPLRFLLAPVAWWISRMLLALLLITALLVEHFLPRSRHTRIEIAGALLTVVGMTYLITAALRRLPTETSRHPGAFFPSSHQLLPAAIFLVALIWYRRRLHNDGTAFDRAIFSAAILNFATQIAASQSERLLDTPFMFAQGLTLLSYTIALGGALLDNARLFEQVRHLAVSDPLTGLANYRKLLDVLENETERTDRTNRPFAVLLLDLDGLKKINDSLGHLAGSRALCRVADILRVHCRAIDTAARYGGDEFALVLPETEDKEAHRVADRIRDVMANDTEPPPISASIGISIYRGDGERIEKLLAEADEHLYAEKARRKQRALPVAQPRRRTPKT